MYSYNKQQCLVTMHKNSTKKGLFFGYHFVKKTLTTRLQGAIL